MKIDPDHRIESAWPNATQLLALKAALLPPAEAITYWKKLCETHDMQELDHGTNQVLPKIYLNLQSVMPDDINKKIAGSSYKYHWARNRMLMHDTQMFLKLMQDNGLDGCLLKGGAFLGHYFPEYGMRAIGDTDILVPVAELPRMINLLEENDYTLKSNQPGIDRHSLIRLFHARSFENSRKTELDIHQYLSSFLVNSEFNEILWNNMLKVQVTNSQTNAYVLNPAFQLLHTIIHGMQYSPVSSIRWILDAATLLQRHADDVDWEKLKEISRQFHLTLTMKHALNFLKMEMSCPIPEAVVDDFNKCKITTQDQTYYNLSSNIGMGYTLDRIKRSWAHYKVYSLAKNQQVSPLGFYEFLTIYLNLKSGWSLIPYASWKIISKLADQIFAFRVRKETTNG